MNNYDDLTMDQILELKRAKEVELTVLREEVRELARAEERLVRFEDLQRRMGGNVTAEDLELLGKVIATPQVMSAPGVESAEKTGDI